MKKFFVSLEEQAEVAVLDEEIAPELVVEEDPDAVDDLSEDIIQAEETSQSIDTDISDTQRAEDTVESLESLCEIISRMDAPTPVNVAMIKLVANTGVTGTNVPAQNLFSSNEDFSDLTVTVEGIQDKIKAVGASIAKSFSTVAGKVANFIKGIMSAYARFSQKIAEVKAKLEEVRKSKTAKSVSVNIRAADGLYINGNPVKDSKEYLNALKLTNKSMIGLSELFVNQTTKSFNDCFELLKNVVKNKEKAEENFLKVFKAYDEEFFGRLIKLPGMSVLSDAEVENEFDTDYESETEMSYRNKSMLGNLVIYVSVPKPNSFDKTNVKEIKKHISDFYLGTWDTVKHEDVERGTTVTNVLFNDIQFSYVEQLIAECEKTLLIAKNYSTKMFKFAQFANSGKQTALITSVFAAIYAASGAAAYGTTMATANPGVGVATGVAAGVVTAKAAGAALSVSANVKLINNINFNLSYMSKATWRHSNMMLNTGLAIANKILSSKEWTAQTAA